MFESLSQSIGTYVAYFRINKSNLTFFRGQTFRLATTSNDVDASMYEGRIASLIGVEGCVIVSIFHCALLTLT